MQMQSEQINELAEALSKAQGQIEGAVKDAKNPFFKSNYADLHSVIACAKAPLSDNGLAVIQTTHMIEAQLYLVTTLAHKSGQWIKSSMPIILQKQDAQSMGSAITYLRRYSYQAICGISAMDDDGESTMDRKPKETPVVKNEQESPTLQDLEVALFSLNLLVDRGTLALYVKEKAIELGIPEATVIKRSVINKNGELQKLAAGYKAKYSAIKA